MTTTSITATDMVRALTGRELDAVARRIRKGDEYSPEYAYAVSAETRRRLLARIPGYNTPDVDPFAV